MTSTTLSHRNLEVKQRYIKDNSLVEKNWWLRLRNMTSTTLSHQNLVVKQRQRKNNNSVEKN